MSRLCRESEWPLPASADADVSLEFHLDRYARWLLTAGADPRLSIVLCAGETAKANFIEGMTARKITPEIALATSKQPVAPNLSQHQGTHFNSTLYLVDGLKSLDRDALNTLNGQRGLLNRMATWVALIVEDMDTLCRLYQFSDGLMRETMRRALVVSGTLPDAPQAPAPASQMNLWRRHARVAELAFHTMMTHAVIADYDDVSRTLRSGYGGALNTLPMGQWTPWQRLWHGAEPGGRMTADIASAWVRHLPDLPQESLLGDALATRPLCAVHVPSPPSGLPALMASGPQGNIAGWAASLRDVTGAWRRRDAERAVVELHIAEHYAAAEDLEGCLDALTQGLEASRTPACPEVFFEVAAFLLKLHILLGQRKEALMLLNDLESRVPELHSPFYDARIHLARGDYRAPLDPTPARVEYTAAIELFRIHGYATWADVVEERVRGVS